MAQTELSGTIAVITGAGSGIGACVAKALAEHGAMVALVGRRMDRLEKVAAEIHALDGKAIPFSCDVSRPDEVEKLHERVRDTLGPATVLFNAAGVFGQAVPVAQSSPEQWMQTLQINVVGPYLTCRAFMGGMIERGWGRLINISSAASVLPPGGHSSAYQLSKVAPGSV